MSETSIEWADYSFNPWYGCQKVGPGCDHCYAEGWAKRSGLVKWGPGETRRRSSAANWTKPLQWDTKAGRLGIRYRVFCASLADVFDNAVPQGWRTDLWRLTRETPNLDWLLVTKRIGNVTNMLPADWGAGYPNACLLATVTDQQEADRDVPQLLAVPAAVRGLSMEPLLGPVDLSRWLDICQYEEGGEWGRRNIGHLRDMLDWTIVGGESGHQARPMHPQWTRLLRDQCTSAGVPFFFKQWGGWKPLCTCTDAEIHSLLESSTREAWIEPASEGDYSQFRVHETHSMFKIGKKRAGRKLDGRTWDQYPSTTAATGGAS